MVRTDRIRDIAQHWSLRAPPPPRLRCATFKNPATNKNKNAGNNLDTALFYKQIQNRKRIFNLILISHKDSNNAQYNSRLQGKTR